MRDATPDAGSGCLWLSGFGPGTRAFSAIRSRSCALAAGDHSEDRRHEAAPVSSRRSKLVRSSHVTGERGRSAMSCWSTRSFSFNRNARLLTLLQADKRIRATLGSNLRRRPVPWEHGDFIAERKYFFSDLVY